MSNQTATYNHGNCQEYLDCSTAAPLSPTESYSYETIEWVPESGLSACAHEWLPARAKGKSKWCKKCGEYA
jgi:hypothetical protein